MHSGTRDFRRPSGRPLAAAVAIAASALAAGCATPPVDADARAAYEMANDPLEPMNRGIFEFNRIVDGLLIRNVAALYRGVLPQEVRQSVRNALDNLGEPVVFANNLMQGEIERACTTAGRFTINSTLGVAGIFDWAKGWGLPKQTGDFGQTLWAWGIPDGPYLVIPLLGPSNPRDAFGEVVDGYIDPFGYVLPRDPMREASQARLVTDGIDRRSRALDELDEIEKTSIDYYAELRSLWRQMREAQLHGRDTQDLKSTPTTGDGFYDDPGAGADTSSAGTSEPL